MLIYDPALDPYHCAIRVLAIAESAGNKAIELTLDAARIADYFLVYPAKLVSFRFPDEFKSVRADAKLAENPYRQASGNRATFERMRPIFFAALSGLVAAGFVDGAAVREGTLLRTSEVLPETLAAAVDRFQTRQPSAGSFVLSGLLEISPNGKDGLKHRSGLIEHRYDIV